MNVRIDETLEYSFESSRVRLLHSQMKGSQVEEGWKLFCWHCLPVLVMWQWQISERRKA